MENTYWAASERGKIADEVLLRVTSQKEFLQSSGYISEMRKSYTTYYGTSYIDTIDQSLKAIHVNHYANLIRHIHVMVTSQRPAWEPRAINSDLESQATTLLASALLDNLMREKQVDKKLNESVEKALFLREAWISLDWAATGGEVYGKNDETGEPIYEGDIEVNTHTLLDITRDYSRRDMNHQWYIVRKFKKTNMILLQNIQKWRKRLLR